MDTAWLKIWILAAERLDIGWLEYAYWVVGRLNLCILGGLDVERMDAGWLGS
jgi:hypothetical protein